MGKSVATRHGFKPELNRFWDARNLLLPKEDAIQKHQEQDSGTKFLLADRTS